MQPIIIIITDNNSDQDILNVKKGNYLKVPVYPVLMLTLSMKFFDKQDQVKYISFYLEQLLNMIAAPGGFSNRFLTSLKLSKSC